MNRWQWQPCLPKLCVRLRFLSCCFNQARLISSRPVMTVKLLQQSRSVGKCGFQFHFGHWHHLPYSTWFPAAQVISRDSLMCLEPWVQMSWRHWWFEPGKLYNLVLSHCSIGLSSESEKIYSFNLWSFMRSVQAQDLHSVDKCWQTLTNFHNNRGFVGWCRTLGIWAAMMLFLVSSILPAPQQLQTEICCECPVILRECLVCSFLASSWPWFFW